MFDAAYCQHLSTALRRVDCKHHIHQKYMSMVAHRPHTGLYANAGMPCRPAGASQVSEGAASGGDPGAFALGMTGCNKREHHTQVCCLLTLLTCMTCSSASPLQLKMVHTGDITTPAAQLLWQTVMWSQTGQRWCCLTLLNVFVPAAAFQLLAQRFDFSRYKTLGDIGGSAGVLCCAVAQAHPHMTCTTLDLPAVHAAAEQYITSQGLQDRVKVRKQHLRSESCLCSESHFYVMNMLLTY